MPHQYEEIKEIVKRRLRGQYNEMRAYLVAAKPSLWGEERPRHWISKVFVLSMYHDITALGYRHIIREVEGLGFAYNHKSFQHNTEVIRRILAKWGKKQAKLGSKAEWEYAMRNVPGKKNFPDLCFWMDSTDFAMENKV
jgi:hypothetical protein